MAVICSCQSRRDAMRLGEIAQDRFGMWHYPLDTITGWYAPSVARRFHWTHCPFCNELLPNVELFKPGEMDVTDGTDEQADGN